MAVKNKIDEAIDDISKRIRIYNEHRKLFQDLFRQVKDKLNPSEFPTAYHRKDNKPLVRYIPEEQPFPDILTSIEPLSQNEIESLISIWRMQKEIKCGIDLLEEDHPDIIILDGSVLPVILRS